MVAINAYCGIKIDADIIAKMDTKSRNEMVLDFFNASKIVKKKEPREFFPEKYAKQIGDLHINESDKQSKFLGELRENGFSLEMGAAVSLDVNAKLPPKMIKDAIEKSLSIPNSAEKILEKHVNNIVNISSGGDFNVRETVVCKFPMRI